MSDQSEILIEQTLKDVIAVARSWAFKLFLFSVPIFYLSGVADLRVLQERYFQGAVMALAALFFGNIWLTLFVWLNLALLVYNGGEVGGAQVLSVFFTGVMFLVSKAFFTDNGIKPYASILGWVCVVSTIFVITQALGIDPIHVHVDATGTNHPDETLKLQTGMFLLPAFNAIFMAIAASILVFTHSWVWLILAVPVIFARCSAAGLAFAFIFTFWTHYKFGARSRYIGPVLIAVMLIGGCGYLVVDYKSDKLTFLSRFESQHLMIRKGLEKQFGYGPDSFRNYTKHKNFIFKTDENYHPLLCEKINESSERITYYSADLGQRLPRFKGKVPAGINMWDVAHNEYLQLFFEYGYAGVLLLIGLLLDIWRRFSRSLKTPEVLGLFACLVVYAIVSLTQFPFHLARLGGIFGIILGAYYAKTTRNTFRDAKTY